MAVLYGIVVHVVEVPLEIVLVLDRVLPLPRLPDAAVAAFTSGRTHFAFRAAGSEPLLREFFF